MVTVKKFSAVWCGPCRALAPVINEIKSAYVGVKFEEYDVDNEVDEVVKYAITSVPTIIIEKNGKILERIAGLQSKVTYQKALNEAVK